jgi:hypothetical protein
VLVKLFANGKISQRKRGNHMVFTATTISCLALAPMVVVWRRMVSLLPVQTRARLRALQARIAEVVAAGGTSASAQLDKLHLVVLLRNHHTKSQWFPSLSHSLSLIQKCPKYNVPSRLLSLSLSLSFFLSLLLCSSCSFYFSLVLTKWPINKTCTKGNVRLVGLHGLSKCTDMQTNISPISSLS